MAGHLVSNIRDEKTRPSYLRRRSSRAATRWLRYVALGRTHSKTNERNRVSRRAASKPSRPTQKIKAVPRVATENLSKIPNV